MHKNKENKMIPIVNPFSHSSNSKDFKIKTQMHGIHRFSIIKNGIKIERNKYFIGFFCTIAAGLLFALYLPVIELVYRRVYCYHMVMDMQLMEVAVTLLASIGMSMKVKNYFLTSFNNEN
ncbi:hypothetical protein Ahy_A04g020725 [Arachis hypogaea]|uniref:Uncharacterized protein n=1 Tax=Arachis hypogaea TaxID=3818 RepID=A0A445DIH4_ARAHY|nr:hypothetical protein Ahy_A04g020725 [Arachis hypogaea]